MVFCHHGSSHSPPDNLKRGQVIAGADGQKWALMSTAEGSHGPVSTFVLDREKQDQRNCQKQPPRPVRRPPTEDPVPEPARMPEALIEFAPLSEAAFLDGIKRAENSTSLDFAWFIYSDTQRTQRQPKTNKDGRPDKAFIPHHLNGSAPNLTSGAGPEFWPLWHEQDLQDLDGHWVLELEGEKCANIARAGGVIATSQPGHARTVDQRCRRYETLRQNGAAGVVYLADNDDQGKRFAKEAEHAAAQAGLPIVVVPAAELHPQMPEKGSIDDLCQMPQKGGLGCSIPHAIELIQQNARKKQIELFAAQPEPEVVDPPVLEETAQPEEHQSAAATEIAQAVTEAKQATDSTLDPAALIGGELGRALSDRADRLNVPTAVLINGLLPVAASQLQFGTQVMISEEMNWFQPPILWNLSVAETGSNKTETSDLCVQPLYGFDRDLPDDAERKFFTSTFTLPGLSRVQAAQPDHGCLINTDEFSGTLRKLFNDQRSGRGDELSRLLSVYDGKPQRATFSDKSLNYNLKGSSFSLLSTIQPSVLLDCMGDLTDESGLFARFNLCEIPLKRRTMSRTGRKPDGLMAELQNAYLCLQTWKPRIYGLTDEAMVLFDEFHENCENQRLDQAIEPALRAYAAKQEGRCGRIALVLHCIQAAARRVPPDELISAETMLGAITICDFYAQQLRRFYALSLASAGGSLKGITLLVFQVLKDAEGQVQTERQIGRKYKLREIPSKKSSNHSRSSMRKS
ncbi:DUF3987 domain-containing protein [Synechococcus sp. MIT S9507]|uniref:DUF3987 domain-containing protein n=1 Tax=Synechococcus sp. MIT S9507 TaxID=3082544 RepID=UPI0039B54D76